jgi:hypothetical protein
MRDYRPGREYHPGMREERVLRVSVRRRKATLTGLLTAIAMLGVGGASASAATEPTPAWSVQSVAQPTSFSASENARCESTGRCDQYTLVLSNVGSLASDGLVTVVDRLPEGITAGGAPSASSPEEGEAFACSTEAVAAHSVITCASDRSIPALTPAIAAISIPVVVSLGVPSGSTLVNSIEVSGGAGKTIEAATPTPIEGTPTSFDPLEFSASLLGAAGVMDTQAADRPAAFTTSLAIPSALAIPANVGTQIAPYPVGSIKQIVIDLPPGVVGDALAAPTCPLSDVANLTKQNPNACPPATQIGTSTLIEPEDAVTELKIFNVTPEHGYVAEFAVFLPLLGHSVLLYASLVGGGAHAHVRIVSGPLDATVSIVGASFTFFGDPAAIDTGALKQAAFLTSSSDCGAAGLTTTVHLDSWQQPAKEIEPGNEPDFAEPGWKSASSTVAGVTDCGALEFHPTLSLAPEATHSLADEPAGYEAKVEVPQDEDPDGLATPPLKTVTVTLPAGVSVSLPATEGLSDCAAEGAEGIDLESGQAGHCPPASTVGEAEVVTPLLGEALKGGLYLAQPACGGAGQPACGEAAAEQGGLLALYLEASSEARGVHVKLKGMVEIGGEGREGKHNDLRPGQVRVTFAEMPQEPIGQLRLSFHGGPRALLANPQSCGSFATEGELEPWSHLPAVGEAEGTPNLTVRPSFTIAGCEGRFAPGFAAGTTDPQAGAYSPFTLSFAREDREQDLSGLSLTTPPGLLANLASVPLCAEPQAAAGTCAQVSEVGTATVAAGAGADPLYLSGHVYLTGAYDGEPYGLSILVPAEAGPFHLGIVNVRASIAVDPATAALTIATGGLPQSIDGIPLRLRTVGVTLSRAGFIFNPTSCEPLTVSGTIASAQGAIANVISRFQAASCESLKFSPKLTVSTEAHAEALSDGIGASLNVKLASRGGAGVSGEEANIKRLDLTLPRLLPARLQPTLQNACTEAQFAKDPAGCPPDSFVGTATALTPVLDVPLTGPAIFVSHGGLAFPDLDLVLQGEGVEIRLTGHTDIERGMTHARFETFPDVPISSFDLMLPGGPHSALASGLPINERSLCGQTLQMPTMIEGQNGAVIKETTKIAVTGCSPAIYVVSRKVKGKTATIQVKVPAAGKLVATAKGLSKASKTAKLATILTLKLTLTNTEVAFLGKHKARKLKAKINLQFTPKSGAKLKVTTTVLID